MKNRLELPASMLGNGTFAQSPAFEIREGKLIIKFEPEIPYVKLDGKEFAAVEAPSLVVGGKKLPVSEIA